MRFSAHAFTRPSVLPMLAHLMLRNHHELASLFGASLERAPTRRQALNLEFGTGGLIARLHVPEAGNTLCLAMLEGERSFSVRIPLALHEGKAQPVEVTWTQAGAAPQTKQLSPAEFLDLKTPQEFKELHARLASYLRSVLPAALLKKLGLAEVSQGQPPVSGAADTKASTAASDAPGATPAKDPAESGDVSLAHGASRAETAPGAEAWAPAEAAGVPNPFQAVRLSRANLCDLEFDGRLLAQAISPVQHGRQFVLKVFETRGGKFVAARTGLSLWVGERTKTEAEVYDSLAEVTGLLGFSPLAKHLYEALGLNTAQRID